MREGWVERTLGETCEIYQPKTISAKEMKPEGKYPVFGANGIIGRYEQFNHEAPQLLVTCRGATCGSVNVSLPKSWITGNAMVVRPRSDELSVRYLEYFFRGAIDFSNVITGSAQPQITRQSLAPVKISVPPLAEQQHIVAILDEVFAGLATATANAEKNLRNAREMFDSYIGATFAQESGGWLERSLGDACEMYQPRTISTRDLVEDGKYPVYGANGVIGRYSAFNHENAQLLITCRGATCGAVNVSQPKSWITGNAMVVRPRNNDIDIKFLEFTFRGGLDLSPAITGAAQPQITRTSLSPVLLRHPKSIDDQRRLSAAFEEFRAKSIRLEDVYARKLKSLADLKQSILRKAFTGELTSPLPRAIKEAAE